MIFIQTLNDVTVNCICIIWVCTCGRGCCGKLFDGFWWLTLVLDKKWPLVDLGHKTEAMVFNAGLMFEIWGDCDSWFSCTSIPSVTLSLSTSSLGTSSSCLVGLWFSLPFVSLPVGSSLLVSNLSSSSLSSFLFVLLMGFAFHPFSLVLCSFRHLFQLSHNLFS